MADGTTDFEHEVDDARFGTLVVAGSLGVEAAEVVVRGAGVPTARLVRRDVAQATTPPVGTRDPARLDLSLDGAPVVLEPGRGRLARSSYRVTVRPDGWSHPLTLTPSTPYSSRLVRGSRARLPGRELAVLTRGQDGDVGAVWDDRVETVGTAQPGEAALGYLLASAFDTGAELAVVRLLTEGADLLFPG